MLLVIYSIFGCSAKLNLWKSNCTVQLSCASGSLRMGKETIHLVVFYIQQAQWIGVVDTFENNITAVTGTGEKHKKCRHWRLPEVKCMYHIHKLHPQMCNKYKKQSENVKSLDTNVRILTATATWIYNRNMGKKRDREEELLLLIKELKQYDGRFQMYFRIFVGQFKTLQQMLAPHLKRQSSKYPNNPTDQQ